MVSRPEMQPRHRNVQIFMDIKACIFSLSGGPCKLYFSLFSPAVEGMSAPPPCLRRRRFGRLSTAVPFMPRMTPGREGFFVSEEFLVVLTEQGTPADVKDARLQAPDMGLLDNIKTVFKDVPRRFLQGKEGLYVVCSAFRLGDIEEPGSTSPPGSRGVRSTSRLEDTLQPSAASHGRPVLLLVTDLCYRKGQGAGLATPPSRLLMMGRSSPSSSTPMPWVCWTSEASMSTKGKHR